MRKNMSGKALLLVNLAVLLFGTAGLFAKRIHLPALGITFGRVLFSSLALMIFMKVRKQPLKVSGRKDLLLLLGAGLILALHWWSFLASIQVSTVAIGTITFSTFPLFVTFLEPLVFHKRPTAGSVLAAALLMVGVFITVPTFSFENYMFRGVLIGMASSLAYAVLTIMNKRFVNRYSATLTAFYEQSAAAIFLLPFVLRTGFATSPADLSLLLLLGIATTAVAHTLFITSLKHIPARLAGIISAMETVYSILLAAAFLGEIPSVREAVGAVIIVGVVVTSEIMGGKI